MNNEFEKEDVIEFIRNETDKDKLHQFIISSHPYDIANAFEKLEYEERINLYKILTSEELADIFAYIEDEKAADYLEEMDKAQSSSILNEMDVDDAVDIIQELDNPEEIVNLLEEETKEDVSDLTIYKEGTAGSIMTTNYIELDSNMDIKDAMRKVVKEADESEIIDPLFVCDEGVLVGTLDLKDLIVARSPKKINEIMETNFEYVDVDEDIENVNKLINNYDIYALPVLEKNTLLGIITIDDAFEAIEESFKQDYKQMAAINNVEKSDKLFRVFLKRLPWLLILLVLSLIISNVLGLFENVINQVIVLAFFQTMLLDMAGNIGTQSLAVTIQKMTNDEMESKSQEMKHIGREIKINFLNSFLLSIAAYAVSLLFLIIRYNGIENKFMISLVISVSLFLTLLISGFFATLLPIILKKLKIDPALASGPFISTLNDVISIVVYFNIAILFLGLVN